MHARRAARLAEKAAVHGLNDTIGFATFALASAGLESRFGWRELDMGGARAS